MPRSNTSVSLRFSLYLLIAVTSSIAAMAVSRAISASEIPGNSTTHDSPGSTTRQMLEAITKQTRALTPQSLNRPDEPLLIVDNRLRIPSGSLFSSPAQISKREELNMRFNDLQRDLISTYDPLLASSVLAFMERNARYFLDHPEQIKNVENDLKHYRLLVGGAVSSIKIHAGKCGTHVIHNLLKILRAKIPFDRLEIFSFYHGNDDHTFLVLNRGPRSKVSKIKTWNDGNPKDKSFYIIDSWADGSGVFKGVNELPPLFTDINWKVLEVKVISVTPKLPGAAGSVKRELRQLYIDFCVRILRESLSSHLEETRALLQGDSIGVFCRSTYFN